MEAILLNTRSSIEAWQRGFAGDARLLEDARSIACVGNVRSLRALSSAVPPLSMPIAIAVEVPEKRCHARDWQCQVWRGEFPPNSVYLLNEQGICLASPWLCFLQMARKLNLADGIRLGMELCGTHSTLPFTTGISRPFGLSEREQNNGFVETRPVITAAQLRMMLEAMNLGRQSKAVQAARFIIDGSRSPGESRLYIVLCLPTRLGGFGLPKPELNYRIDLPERLCEAARVSCYYCDFYYPDAKLAVEFDGGYHWQGNQRMRDSIRQVLLEELGIHVIRIDKLQLENMDLMNIQAQRLAEALGVKLRKPTESVLHAREALFTQVLDWSSQLYR